MKKAEKAAEKRKLENFKNKTNTAIYVKGLPEDIEHDEIKEFFLKAGIMKIDPDTNMEKIKIYCDDQDRCKVNESYREMLLSFMPWKRVFKSP